MFVRRSTNLKRLIRTSGGSFYRASTTATATIVKTNKRKGRGAKTKKKQEEKEHEPGGKKGKETVTTCVRDSDFSTVDVHERRRDNIRHWFQYFAGRLFFVCLFVCFLLEGRTPQRGTGTVSNIFLDDAQVESDVSLDPSHRGRRNPLMEHDLSDRIAARSSSRDKQKHFMWTGARCPSPAGRKPSHRRHAASTWWPLNHRTDKLHNGGTDPPFQHLSRVQPWTAPNQPGARKERKTRRAPEITRRNTPKQTNRRRNKIWRPAASGRSLEARPQSRPQVLAAGRLRPKDDGRDEGRTLLESGGPSSGRSRTDSVQMRLGERRAPTPDGHPAVCHSDDLTTWADSSFAERKMASTGSRPSISFNDTKQTRAFHDS